MNQRGIFISIEGIEGVGKTTAVRFIESFLKEKEIDFVITREPGGTEIAEQIRQLLLTLRHEETLIPTTELLLMFAARAQHLNHVILPALQANKWVISDRYIDASYAYQGGGRGIPFSQIKLLEEWIVHQVLPDNTLLLDAPAALGLARAKNRSGHDRIEQETIEFFERVRSAYLLRAEADKKRFSVIDATKPLDEVQANIKLVLEKWCVH